MHAAMDTTFKRLTVIKKTEKYPALYDVVAIGTPAWAYQDVYSRQNLSFSKKDCFKKVVFFLTGSGVGNEKVFMDMAEVKSTTGGYSSSYGRGSSGRGIQLS